MIFGGANLADMQLISKCNNAIRFSWCVNDVYSKYAWFIPLKVKKGEAISKAFQTFLKESNRKPSQIWVDTGN